MCACDCGELLVSITMQCVLQCDVSFLSRVCFLCSLIRDIDGVQLLAIVVWGGGWGGLGTRLSFLEKLGAVPSRCWSGVESRGEEMGWLGVFVLAGRGWGRGGLGYRGQRVTPLRQRVNYPHKRRHAMFPSTTTYNGIIHERSSPNHPPATHLHAQCHNARTFVSHSPADRTYLTRISCPTPNPILVASARVDRPRLHLPW